MKNNFWATIFWPEKSYKDFVSFLFWVLTQKEWDFIVRSQQITEEVIETRKNTGCQNLKIFWWFNLDSRMCEKDAVSKFLQCLQNSLTASSFSHILNSRLNHQNIFKFWQPVFFFVSITFSVICCDQTTKSYSFWVSTQK